MVYIERYDRQCKCTPDLPPGLGRYTVPITRCWPIGLIGHSWRHLGVHARGSNLCLVCMHGHGVAIQHITLQTQPLGGGMSACGVVGPRRFVLFRTWLCCPSPLIFPGETYLLMPLHHLLGRCPFKARPVVPMYTANCFFVDVAAPGARRNCARHIRPRISQLIAPFASRCFCCIQSFSLHAIALVACRRLPLRARRNQKRITF